MNASELRTEQRAVDAPDADAVWTPRPGLAVRIVGAGAYVAPHVVTAEDIAGAIPGWAADKIVEKTGVVEPRYLWPLDADAGRVHYGAQLVHL
jgi:hypothetical protein